MYWLILISRYKPYHQQRYKTLIKPIPCRNTIDGTISVRKVMYLKMNHGDQTHQSHQLPCLQQGEEQEQEQEEEQELEQELQPCQGQGLPGLD